MKFSKGQEKLVALLTSAKKTGEPIKLSEVAKVTDLSEGRVQRLINISNMGIGRTDPRRILVSPTRDQISVPPNATIDVKLYPSSPTELRGARKSSRSLGLSRLSRIKNESH